MNLPNEGESPHRGDIGGGPSNAPKKFDDLQKSITMAQIAKAAGVSQGAISSLLNDRDYGIRVSDKTRERVFKVCREMGYIPNDLRAVVRMYPELGDYCLLFADNIPGGLRSPLITRLAAAVMAAVPDSSRPLSLAVYQPDTDYALPGNVLPHAVRSGVCSKFLIFGEPNASLFHALTRRGLPVISLGYHVGLPGVVSILPDYAEVARLAVGHLHQLGHQNFAILSGPFGTKDARLIALNRGVSVACEELGLRADAQNILHGDLTDAAGFTAATELLSRKQKPTAVFCMSDASASGLIAGAISKGVSLPGALSVIGCGNDAGARDGEAQLTTVHIPMEEMAEKGVLEINLLVHDAPAFVPRQIDLAPHLVTGRSTAPRKGA